MTRNDKLRQLARECRGSHQVTLFVVGWYAANAPEEELDALLLAVQEVRGIETGEPHLSAYYERWGRVPDSQL